MNATTTNPSIESFQLDSTIRKEIQLHKAHVCHLRALLVEHIIVVGRIRIDCWNRCQDVIAPARNSVTVGKRVANFIDGSP